VFHSHAKNINHTRSDDSRCVRPRFVANTEGGYLLVSRLTAIKAATGETALGEPPESLIDFVREIQQKDASIHVNHDGKPTAGYERDLYRLLRFHGKVVVLISAALRHEILKRNHDDQVASGHYGVSRTTELISRKYY
jgi:plasmid maintenance system killer protein